MDERGKGDLKMVDKRMREIREKQKLNRAVLGVPDRSGVRPDQSAHLKRCPLGSRETGSIRERIGSIRFWQ